MPGCLSHTRRLLFPEENVSLTGPLGSCGGARIQSVPTFFKCHPNTLCAILHKKKALWQMSPIQALGHSEKDSEKMASVCFVHTKVLGSYQVRDLSNR